MRNILFTFLAVGLLNSTTTLASQGQTTTRKPADADDKIEVQKTLKDVERKLTQSEIEAKVRAQLPKKDSKTQQN